ncbi:MAG: LacI family DNA-binding transcriptional regulator, partial [Flavobacteriaceae bacterium]
KHIARELDVSISTVSKALKNSEEISHDTKEKVQAFAKLYNYRPNNVALSLKNKRTKNIGVIIPDIVHHFFTTVFRGIEQYANEKGYNVITCISDGSFDKEVISMEMLSNGSVDGFIISLSGATFQKKDFTHLEQTLQQGIPLVLFDNITHGLPCDKVVVNDREVARQAVSKLFAIGKKKVGIIVTDDASYVSTERMMGYKDALHDHGVAPGDEVILDVPFKDAEDKLLRQYILDNDLDGILCVNEILAVRCMAIAKSLGRKVPEDMAFIGFTDGILSKYAHPSLSTVYQHGEEMGSVAAKMLIGRIEAEIEDDDEDSPTDYHTEIIKATLIERQSTLG